MPENTIYEDIARRTGGDIYIGCVGPVRTGKSTLIKKFMEALVIPNIENEYDRTRARDEMPQSAAGKTVMTAEPKFIPDEAVGVRLEGGAQARVRFIDCVGYVIPEALGYVEDGAPRMVHTPWQSDPMPFEQAARYGTDKVIRDHSTIGLLVTTDGSICSLPRSAYVQAEEEVAAELKRINKPFAVVLNSADPNSDAAIALALSLEEKYQSPVALVNALQINADDVRHILELVLLEFPVRELRVSFPDWCAALSSDHPLSRELEDKVYEVSGGIVKMKQANRALEKLTECDAVKGLDNIKLDLGCGKISLNVVLQDDLYYKVLSEVTGMRIGSDEELFQTMRELAGTKRKYDRVACALEEAEKGGYGIVLPDSSEFTLEDPQIVRQNGAYSVHLKATAPSLHIIRAKIGTEISPVVGSEEQSKALLDYISERRRDDPSSVWQTNMFGRTLEDMVSDGMKVKLANMSDDARAKMSDTLSRIVNEGSGGLICIIL